MNNQTNDSVISDLLRPLISDRDLSYLERAFAVYRTAVAGMKGIAAVLQEETPTEAMQLAISRVHEHIDTLTRKLVRDIEQRFRNVYFIDFFAYDIQPGVILDRVDAIIEHIHLEIEDILPHAGGIELREALREKLQGYKVEIRGEEVWIKNAVKIHDLDRLAGPRVDEQDETPGLLAAYLKFCYEDTTQLDAAERHAVSGWNLDVTAESAALENPAFSMRIDRLGTVHLVHPSPTAAYSFCLFLQLKTTPSPLA